MMHVKPQERENSVNHFCIITDRTEYREREPEYNTLPTTERGRQMNHETGEGAKAQVSFNDLI